MKVRTIILFNLIAMCLNANAQAREPSETQQLETRNSIFSLPPFERAVCCIKYYEGMHRKKDYPYVGYGHKLLPGEHYSSNMSLTEADLLLRKDLKKFCGMFSAYGKDSLLLAALAYNVGPYRILGCKKKYPKSTLLRRSRLASVISSPTMCSSAAGRVRKFRLLSEDGMQNGLFYT